MFYADFVLSKKGPLSKVWLAAHWEKKLSKAQIFETDVDEAVHEIMRPSQNLALRTTGHLLLGICRVFSRKTKYLLADCNEAFLKIKLVFRNGALDEPNPVLPTFTIQDIYGEFGDSILPEFDEEDLNHAPICQSRYDDITMKEEMPTTTAYNYNEILEDDDFGEIAAGVGPEDYAKFLEDVDKMDIDTEAGESSSNGVGALFGREREQTPALSESHAPGAAIFGDDDFGHGGDEHLSDDEEDHDEQGTSGYHDNHHVYEEDYDYGNDMMMRNETPLRDETPMREDETPYRGSSPAPSVTSSIAPSASGAAADQDTVESYYERQMQKRALQKEPVKKRRLDDVRMITGDEMKANMGDYSDTLTRLDLAPPTRKLMLGKKRSHAEYLFRVPGMIGFAKNKQFVRMYQEALIVTKKEDIEEQNEAIKNAMGLWDIGEEDMQQQQQEMDLHVQDDPQYDDFDDVPSYDYDTIDTMMDIPQSMDDFGMQDDDIPMHNPLSPFASMTDDDEEGSPSEKRRKLTDEKDDMDADEDNKWSKRTHALLQTISHKLGNHTTGQVELDEMLKKGISRKVAAAKFYSLLCLKKNQCIDVAQEEPYGEIIITRGPNIHAAMI